MRGPLLQGGPCPSFELAREDVQPVFREGGWGGGLCISQDLQTNRRPCHWVSEPHSNDPFGFLPGTYFKSERN